tara:strand:+ start:888 stop:1436 length:549 start_codon:yes stop_codon:yes gene_type:complete
MFSDKGIIMARHKDIRKELGTISYTIDEPHLKNKKFNLVEYFQIKKGKTKEDKKEPEVITKKIKVDETKLKQNDMMELLTKPIEKEDKEKKKIKEETKIEDKQEELENFVDIKGKKEKEKEKEKEDEELQKQKEKQEKEKEEQEKLKKELEELEPQSSGDKKKIIIDIENWEPDKDKQPIQL